LGALSTFPISIPAQRTDAFGYDILNLGHEISQSAMIAGGLGPLKRGTVLFGPAPGMPITRDTLLTTAGGGTARCILSKDADASGEPFEALVYTQGKFSANGITFTSQGVQSDQAQLWVVGIYIRRYPLTF
jgi:hypothetical protein